LTKFGYGIQAVRGKGKLIAVFFVLGAGILLVISLPERRPPIGIGFWGYTNDIFGLYTFGLFNVTNGGRRDLHIQQGLTQLKTPDGWIEDGTNLAYRVGSVGAGEHAIVSWVGPGTNCVWRANFQFTELIIPSRWVFRLPPRMREWVLGWYSKPRVWIIGTPEISPPK